MKPLTPEERKAIIDTHPDAAPSEIAADIDEYESLVVALFATDPAQSPAPAPLSLERVTANRLEVLHRRLFRE